MSANPLAKFTVDQLLAEVVRRRNAIKARKLVKNWCHDCAHFKIWTGKRDPPDSYNPCSRAHQMSFRVPEYEGEDYGYYRRICEDRAAIPEPVAIPPMPPRAVT